MKQCAFLFSTWICNCPRLFIEYMCGSESSLFHWFISLYAKTSLKLLWLYNPLVSVKSTFPTLFSVSKELSPMLAAVKTEGCELPVKNRLPKSTDGYSTC